MIVKGIRLDVLKVAANVVVIKALVEKALLVAAKREAEAELKLVNIIKQVCFLVCYQVAEAGTPC